MYGVPPSFRQEVSEDLICSEFLTIWENVLFFQHNVLKSFPIKANSIQFPQKSYKKKYHHTSIILKSRPLKFRIKKRTSKLKTSKKLHEPMNDSQLAKALSMDEMELAEAFGYFENHDLNESAFANMFQDDCYEIDTSGLQLVDYETGIKIACVNVENSSNLADQDLAHTFGYWDAAYDSSGDGNKNQLELQGNCDTDEDAALAAEFGYYDDLDNYSQHNGGYSPDVSDSSSEQESSKCEDNCEESSGDHYSSSDTGSSSCDDDNQESSGSTSCSESADDPSETISSSWDGTDGEDSSASN